MATMWRKAMLYLGLGPDEEYDDYNQGYDDPVAAPQAPVGPAPAATYSEPEQTAIGAVRPMHARPSESSGSGGAPDFATQLSESGSLGGGATVIGGPARPRPRVVRPMPVASTARPRLLVPESFNQAQELADAFKGGQPVVMNLRRADRDVARRLIDFSSGLCYGLGGGMEKLESQVYLVSPSNVEVSDEEKARLREKGFED